MAAYERRSLLDEETEEETGDREISLSPGIVLGIFLALALVCAVFFGFGYSVGRRSAPAASALATAKDAPATSLDSSTGYNQNSKPSPGSLAVAAHPAKSVAPPAEDEGLNEVAQPASEPGRSSADAIPRKSAPVSTGSSGTSSIGSGPVAKPTTIFHPPAVVTPATTASAPAALGAGSIVQVAAFSHQQDAELVAGALRKRGYDVAIRQQAQDSLLHVQLGPFANKKEADAMRQRLQADGYNAIVK